MHPSEKITLSPLHLQLVVLLFTHEFFLQAASKVEGLR
jgi:hypothetical protein